MRNAVCAGLALSLLMGCGYTRYGPETVESANDRLPPFTPAVATTQEFMDGYAAIEANNYAAAEPLLKRSLNAEPNDPYALLAMGAVMERTGRFYEASTYYNSAIKYGGASPLGKTTTLDGPKDAKAQTVAELAAMNLTRLDARR